MILDDMQTLVYGFCVDYFYHGKGEQWFERYAPQIWSDVLDEVQYEKNEAEDIIRRQDEEMEREARVYGSYEGQVDREYHRDRI